MVDEHIIDEVANVEQRVKPFVILGLGSVGSCREQFLPDNKIAFTGLSMITACLLYLNDIDVRLLTTEMVLAKLIVYTLGNIIKPPIHSV